MKTSGRESRRVRQRVDQALDVLRVALAEYLRALPRSRPNAFRDFDLQRLLRTFIDRFNELRLDPRVRTLAFAAKDARNEIAHYTGTLTGDEALRHLATVRRLLEALRAEDAFAEVDLLYREQFRALAAPMRHDDASDHAPVDQPGAAEGASQAAPTPSPSAHAPPLGSTPARPSALPTPPTAPSTASPASGPHRVQQTVKGKYAPLFEHLSSRDGDTWHTTFDEIEAILGSPLPRSARKHRPWWSNGGHSQAKAWLAAGWKTTTAGAQFAAGELAFVRSQAGGHSVAQSPSSTVESSGAVSREGGMSEADRIRAFAADHFIEPARQAASATVTVRAGDVAHRMGLSHNLPNVCNSLGGRKFETLANVTLVDRAGPRAGANAEFTYEIQLPPSHSHRQGLRASHKVDVQAQAARRSETGMSRSPSAGAMLPPRTALVFPCAAAKVAHAGRFRLPDGKPVFFVADPALAPADASALFRHPDDEVSRGRTFRQALDDYNLHSRGENPWRLLPAWELYANSMYRALAEAVGIANLFILSAGWGLIRADYLTPDYDVTFSSSRNVEAFKRRRARDRWNDVNQLTDADLDRVIFAGGMDYQSKFLELTQSLGVERLVFYNSAGSRRTDGARFMRFETDRRTNWHYEWAESFVAGEVASDELWQVTT